MPVIFEKGNNMKITIELDNIDYGALVEQLLPLVGDKLSDKDGISNTILAKFLSMPPSVAKSMINLMPQSKKDELAVSLLNKHKETITRKITQTAKDKGFSFKINKFEVE